MSLSGSIVATPTEIPWGFLIKSVGKVIRINTNYERTGKTIEMIGRSISPPWWRIISNPPFNPL